MAVQLSTLDTPWPHSTFHEFTFLAKGKIWVKIHVNEQDKWLSHAPIGTLWFCRGENENVSKEFFQPKLLRKWRSRERRYLRYVNLSCLTRKSGSAYHGNLSIFFDCLLVLACYCLFIFPTPLEWNSYRFLMIPLRTFVPRLFWIVNEADVSEDERQSNRQKSNREKKGKSKRDMVILFPNLCLFFKIQTTLGGSQCFHRPFHLTLPIPFRLWKLCFHFGSWRSLSLASSFYIHVSIFHFRFLV